MSLLTSNMQMCTHLVKTAVSDGEGGTATSWHEGGVFHAALVLSTSTQSDCAEQKTAKDSLTVTTAREETLKFGDVFRCGGKTYRVVSNGSRTPLGAGLSISQVTAERWELPK